MRGVKVCRATMASQEPKNGLRDLTLRIFSGQSVASLEFRPTFCEFSSQTDTLTGVERGAGSTRLEFM